MKLLMDGKTAIVTGGARGIGKAITKKLAEEGADIAIFEIDEDAGSKSAEEISAACGRTIRSYPVNIADISSVKQGILAVMTDFGKIDVLVNNAALCGPMNFEDYLVSDESLWDKTMSVNLKGTIYMIREVHPHMAAGGGGSIVNIVSEVVRDGGRCSPSEYICSKAGVNILTKRLARDYGAENIRLNAVAPSLVRTEMSENMDFSSFQVPLGRVGTPEEIADAVLFMASDMSSYITGVCLDVNGGTTMMS